MQQPGWLSGQTAPGTLHCGVRGLDSDDRGALNTLPPNGTRIITYVDLSVASACAETAAKVVDAGRRSSQKVKGRWLGCS
jgi:hypothetical protein